ncbi:MAG: DUF3306 domain-containing protein [Variovorax sp.]|nr:DUF3306 domain-containing protein [Variovorax sp.]
MSDGFFDRWSRRKQQARAGEVPAEPAPPQPDAPALRPPAEAAPGAADARPAAAPGEAPPLTLADVQVLAPDADFSPFVAKEVAPEVRNAAFRKLFSDPHFNVMDGLDVYIDDYSKPSPLPESVLRQMASAKFLNLFDQDPAHPEETPGDDGLSIVAKSEGPGDLSSPPPASEQPASQKTDDQDTDLRLQPDDAPRAEDARGRAD